MGEFDPRKSLFSYLADSFADFEHLLSLSICNLKILEYAIRFIKCIILILFP